MWWNITSGILPVNAHVVINIVNLSYMNSFILCSSMTKLSNDMCYMGDHNYARVIIVSFNFLLNMNILGLGVWFIFKILMK